MQSEDTWMELHALRRHGWSIAALARELRELREDYGYRASYASLRRRVVELRPHETAEPEIRFETGPGI